MNKYHLNLPFGLSDLSEDNVPGICEIATVRKRQGQVKTSFNFQTSFFDGMKIDPSLVLVLHYAIGMTHEYRVINSLDTWESMKEIKRISPLDLFGIPFKLIHKFVEPALSLKDLEIWYGSSIQCDRCKKFFNKQPNHYQICPHCKAKLV